MSLRGPVHITGTFRDPDFGVSGQTIARGVGAAALALINPLLALIPMIETGPGEDVHCRRVLQSVGGAVRQSGKKISDAPPDASADVTRDKPAPIVDARKKDLIEGREQPAPIVDVAPKKSARG